MAFDERLYKVISEKSLGQVNGWKGETKIVRYSYGGKESVKIIVSSQNGKGEKYEWKILSGVPVPVLIETVLPALVGLVRDELKAAKAAKAVEPVKAPAPVSLPSKPIDPKLSKDRRRRARA